MYSRFIYLVIYYLSIRLFFVVLEINLGPSHVLPKYSADELHSQLLIFRLFHLPLDIQVLATSSALFRKSLT